MIPLLKLLVLPRFFRSGSEESVYSFAACVFSVECLSFAQNLMFISAAHSLLSLTTISSAKLFLANVAAGFLRVHDSQI